MQVNFKDDERQQSVVYVKQDRKTNPSLPPSFKLKAGPLDLVLEEVKSLGGGGCGLVVELVPDSEA